MTGHSRRRAGLGRSSWWAPVRSALADLALGARCAGCAAVADVWCGACDAATGAPRQVGSVAGLPVMAAGRYDGPVGRAVIAHKERGRLSLAVPLGRLLAGAVLAAAPPMPLVVVPVPSEARVVRARGQDHALRLAASAARQLRDGGFPVRAVPALVVVRPVRDQVGLSAAARRDNLAGAFGARGGAPGRLRGRAVVVVDDVVTTGSSLAAAVEAVVGTGAQVTGCAVLASVGVAGPLDPPRGGNPRLA